MKRNYTAWNIDPFELNGGPEDLVKFAVLAPSSHNSQPWVFRIEGCEVTISKNKKRLIPVGDPKDRFSDISLGCALANLLLAADFFGYAYKLDLSTQKSITVTLSRTNHKQNTLASTLFSSITKRVTNRGPYEKKPLPTEALKDLENQILPNVTANICVSTTEIDSIAKLCVDASIEVMSKRSFRAELSEYVRSNITSHPTGMPGFGMGIGMLPSLFGSYMVRQLNVARLSKKKDYETLRSTSAFIILSTKNDSFEDRVNCGQSYEKIALYAQSVGLRTAVWGAPTVVDSSSFRLSKILNLHGIPQIIFRIGYPTLNDPQHSPRLQAECVIEAVAPGTIPVDAG